MTDKQLSRLTKLLLTVAIVCIISRLAPQNRGYVDPEPNEVIIEWSLGVNSSPFWENGLSYAGNAKKRIAELLKRDVGSTIPLLE